MVKSYRDMTREELVDRIKELAEKCTGLRSVKDDLENRILKSHGEKIQLQDDAEAQLQRIKKLEERITGLESDLKTASAFKAENEMLWKRNGKYSAMVTKLIDALWTMHSEAK